ncbi:MAG: cobalamin-dependent protein [Clostridia bacterium]
MSDVLKKIEQAIYDGDGEASVKLAVDAAKAGMDPNEIINQGGVPGLERLGVDFDNMEVFLPELVVGGEAMTLMIEALVPYFALGEETFKGTVVIGCAKGDLHDIGKNLVATQLAVNGFKVHDAGTDVAVNKFVDLAKEFDADIIAVSSLLTTSAYYQDELVKRLEIEGLRDKYKIIVGGGPITPDWTRKIKADGYSRTAHLAVDMCKELLKKAGALSEPLIYE